MSGRLAKQSDTLSLSARLEWRDLDVQPGLIDEEPTVLRTQEREGNWY
jgi:hypothetical protein